MSVNKYKVSWGKDVCYGILKILRSDDVDVHTSFHALKLLFNLLCNQLNYVSQDIENKIKDWLLSSDKEIRNEALKIVSVLPQENLTKNLLKTVSNIQYRTTSEYAMYILIWDRSISSTEGVGLEIIPRLLKGEVEIIENNSKYSIKDIRKMTKEFLKKVCFDKSI